jgi:DNA-binding transcriptional LysR family regulator
MLDLRHLRHALALAETGHYARAAKACHISQPAMTRSIQALESALGVQLFDRNREGVEPTEFGRLLLRHAAGLDMASRELEREVQLARGLEVGELTVGVGPFGGAALVGPVVARLNLLYPKLHIRIVVSPWKELPEKLRSRMVDIVVAEMSDIAVLSDMEAAPLSTFRALVVCRAGHPLAHMETATPADLFRYPLAGPQLPAAAQKHIQSLMPAAMRDGLPRLGLLAVECDSSAILKSILLSSDAVSMMNRFMIEAELGRGELVCVNRIDVGLRMRYGAGWHAGRTMSVAATEFLRILRQEDAAAAALESAINVTSP